MILTTALASSAYRSGPLSNNHCDGSAYDPLCEQTSADFHVQVALSQDTARWVALSAAYDQKVEALSQYNARWEALGESIAYQANNQQRALKANAARWNASAAFYSGQQNNSTAADSARWAAAARFFKAYRPASSSTVQSAAGYVSFPANRH